MAEESSLAASSSLSTPNNWWDLHPPTSLSCSWHPDDRAPVAPPSFTNAPGRSTDSSSHDHRLMGEDLSDNHIWRHVFSSVGDNGSAMHNNEDNMLEPACNYLKQLETWELTHSPSFNNVGDQSNHFTNSELFTNNNNFKVENQCHEMEQVLGYHYGILHNNSPRNSSESMSLSYRSGKPLIDNDNIRATTRSLKSMTLSDVDCKKQAQQIIISPTRMDRGHIIHEGKKKRMSEDNSETAMKKTKQESPLTTNKVPKVKLAEKISALQQIVSPFGKTDTASVLYEAIGYIKFLQEQIQMLSNPYMKTTSHKVSEVDKGKYEKNLVGMAKKQRLSVSSPQGYS